MSTWQLFPFSCCCAGEWGLCLLGENAPLQSPLGHFMRDIWHVNGPGRNKAGAVAQSLRKAALWASLFNTESYEISSYNKLSRVEALTDIALNAKWKLLPKRGKQFHNLVHIIGGSSTSLFTRFQSNGSNTQQIFFRSVKNQPSGCFICLHIQALRTSFTPWQRLPSASPTESLFRDNMERALRILDVPASARPKTWTPLYLISFHFSGGFFQVMCLCGTVTILEHKLSCSWMRGDKRKLFNYIWTISIICMLLVVRKWIL